MRASVKRLSYEWSIYVFVDERVKTSDKILSHIKEGLLISGEMV